MEARELSFPMPSAAAFHQTAALFGRCAGYSSPSSPVYTMIISRGAFVKLNPPQTKPFSLHTETRDFFFLGGGLSFEKERPPPNLPQRNQYWGSRLFAMGSAAAKVSGHGPPLEKVKGPQHPSEKKPVLGIDDSCDLFGGSKGEQTQHSLKKRQNTQAHYCTAMLRRNTSAPFRTFLVSSKESSSIALSYGANSAPATSPGRQRISSAVHFPRK